VSFQARVFVQAALQAAGHGDFGLTIILGIPFVSTYAFTRCRCT